MSTDVKQAILDTIVMFLDTHPDQLEYAVLNEENISESERVMDLEVGNDFYRVTVSKRR